MGDATSFASFATSIAIGFPLLASFAIIWVGMRSDRAEGAKRDTASSIMLGVAFALALALLAAGALVGSGGTAYLGLLKGGLLLMAAFAIVGMGFGLIRGLRSGRAVN